MTWSVIGIVDSETIAIMIFFWAPFTHVNNIKKNLNLHRPYALGQVNLSTNPALRFR